MFWWSSWFRIRIEYHLTFFRSGVKYAKDAKSSKLNKNHLLIHRNASWKENVEYGNRQTFLRKFNFIHRFHFKLVHAYFNCSMLFHWISPHCIQCHLPFKPNTSHYCSWYFCSAWRNYFHIQTVELTKRGKVMNKAHTQNTCSIHLKINLQFFSFGIDFRFQFQFSYPFWPE